MRRGVKQQMTAFNEFLEDKADGSMLANRRGGKIYSSECAREETRGAPGTSLLVGIPRDSGPELAGTMDGKREK